MDCARLEVEGSSTLNPIHKEEKVLIIFYDREVKGSVHTKTEILWRWCYLLKNDYKIFFERRPGHENRTQKRHEPLLIPPLIYSANLIHMLTVQQRDQTFQYLLRQWDMKLGLLITTLLSWIEKYDILWLPWTHERES